MAKDTVIALLVLMLLIVLAIIFGGNVKQLNHQEIIPTEEVIVAAEEIEVDVFFIDRDLMNEGIVDYDDMMEGVKRTVLADSWNPEKALELLFNGLNEEENIRLETSLPAEASWNNLLIEDGIAYLDLSEKFEKIAGSAAVITLREQITRTLLQFPGINQLVITVAGGLPEESLQP